MIAGDARDAHVNTTSADVNQPQSARRADDRSVRKRRALAASGEVLDCRRPSHRQQ